MKEGLHSLAVRRLKLDNSLFEASESLSQREKDFHFAMQCNGYFLLKSGEWWFDSDTTRPFVEEFKGQYVSFFGPNSYNPFFSCENVNHVLFIDAFSQIQTTGVIGKYRKIDEDQAARIAFLFGGMVRHLVYQNILAEKIRDAVKFAAGMTMLGERQSADAIASAMAMYIISGGSLDEDRYFTGTVYHMAEAVRRDPVVPLETKDLGLSQVARLRTFVHNIQAEKYPSLPDTAGYEAAFDEFPTVGAEFHFPSSALREYPNFWQRLAILNMSQYQRGSYVQLSRNDRDVIEVRMNPSIYPITIANWKHIRFLLPELNQAFFTLTINRKNKTGDFSWSNNRDIVLLNNLRALGLLSYAGLFKNVPRMEKSEEIDFGTVYLGQTVKIHNGEYTFSGNWSGGKGHWGQFAIYAGFGNNFPYLAYYLSMTLANPNILTSVRENLLPQIKTLKDALAVKPDDRRGIFSAIQSCVETDERLSKAFESGKRIVELLNP